LERLFKSNPFVADYTLCGKRKKDDFPRHFLIFQAIQNLPFFKWIHMPFPVSCYIGLVHGPIRSKDGTEITTSVTNLDIHDIARTARTFGFKRYFLVTPIKNQQAMVNKILGFWESDSGLIYNPDRKNALSEAQVIDSIEDAVKKITEIEGRKPCVVVTGANFSTFDGYEKDLITGLKKIEKWVESQICVGMKKKDCVEAIKVLHDNSTHPEFKDRFTQLLNTPVI
jgi:hypothetical protein